MPHSLSHVKCSDYSRVITLSKRGADVDILHGKSQDLCFISTTDLTIGLLAYIKHIFKMTIEEISSRFIQQLFIIKINQSPDVWFIVSSEGLYNSFSMLMFLQNGYHSIQIKKIIVLERFIPTIRHLHQYVNYRSICKVMEWK